MGDGPSVIGLIVRLVLSLGVVIGLLLAAAAVVRRRAGFGLLKGLGGGGKTKLDVLGRSSLGRSASVAVVRFGERAVLVGVTDERVSVLAEAPVAEVVAPEPVAATSEVLDLDEIATGRQWTALPGGVVAPRPGPSWKGVVDAMRERTVRRS